MIVRIFKRNDGGPTRHFKEILNGQVGYRKEARYRQQLLLGQSRRQLEPLQIESVK